MGLIGEKSWMPAFAGMTGLWWRAVLILTVLVLPNVCLASANRPNSYRYEPSVSEVSGRLEWKKYYSQQPAYYEAKDNPPKVNVLVLIPDQPIDVVATALEGSDVDSFEDIPILEVDESWDFKRYVGRHVKISGYLYERTRGVEYTDVLLWVMSIDLEPGFKPE